MLTHAEPAASDRAPQLRAIFTPEHELERHLESAAQDPRYRHWLLGALLAGKVFVTDYEIVLDEPGPYLELCPDAGPRGPVLAVYTSRNRVPAGVPVMDAQAMPFAYLLGVLDCHASMIINPGEPHAHQLSCAELELLRRVVHHG